MKKILIFACLFLNITFAFARDVVAVSIPMQKEFVGKIAGEFYDVVSLVTPGINPHDFEPKASDIKKINKAVAYFSIGIEFEEAWIPRFKGQNQAMKIFNTNANVALINFTQNEHNHAHDEHGDTHIWLSPSNAKIIAKNIFEGLKNLNPKEDFSKNYHALISEIDEVDRELREILKDLPKHQKFVVFHPMLGYFARDYHLEEVSIEVEGKSPKMQEMIAVIEAIKQENLKMVFAQPEFSAKAAEFIAKESGAKLGYFSPLQTPWGENLLNFAKTLAEFQK
ncbi:ABC transporter [Helicobacter sp. MIT 11-5569]|uniref:metal ABC transporter solute-binding protein, Zn/Mn family n=1 Tax=Helicobacter sp. MIT 11-5569 TaxID=1548151 RepID=UPI00051F8CEB|nr:zinc ABC transporter substrate-binding protein [Helicobacter sp. MIT 11-5569]TLD85275.1 ABC transporter [Helicobacter sp. MIT 11-5569]